MALVRAGGALTVAFILGFIVLMRRRERRAYKERRPGVPVDPVERHA